MSNEKKGYSTHQKIEIITIIVMAFSVGLLVQMFLTPFIITLSERNLDTSENLSGSQAPYCDEVSAGYLGGCTQRVDPNKADNQLELPKNQNYVLNKTGTFGDDKSIGMIKGVLQEVKFKDVKIGNDYYYVRDFERFYYMELGSQVTIECFGLESWNDPIISYCEFRHYDPNGSNQE